MTINDDWLIKSMFNKLLDALDETLAEIKDSGLLEDESFRDWTSRLYDIIDKYND